MTRRAEVSARAFRSAAFLRFYWQRRALVMRGLFASWRDTFGPDDYAGLACREDVESRLVRTAHARRPWRVSRGPFTNAALRGLPPSHWSLLIEGVEVRRPQLRELRRPFRFLPEWRFDDVMVSLSPVGGSVGPHVDSYDVFLIQGRGRRLWEVDPRAEDRNVRGLPLRILRRFAPRPSERFILETGDVLYVPPGLAHRGTTLDSPDPVAVTYSVGFRAPTAGALAAATAGHLLSGESARDRPRLFSDAGRPASRGTRLDPSDVRRLRDIVRREISGLDDADWRAIAETALLGKHRESRTRS